MVRAILKKFRCGEKGFTLIELLVVVAILGALAAVAIPNVGSFIGEGQSQAQETELHNVQTATMALMAASDDGSITTLAVTAATATNDMDDVTATVGGNSTALSVYMTGLDTNNCVQTGCTYYWDTSTGDVIQITP